MNIIDIFFSGDFSLGDEIVKSLENYYMLYRECSGVLVAGLVCNISTILSNLCCVCIESIIHCDCVFVFL